MGSKKEFQVCSQHQCPKKQNLGCMDQRMDKDILADSYKGYYTAIRGTWLAQWENHATLDLRVMSSSPH